MYAYSIYIPNTAHDRGPTLYYVILVAAGSGRPVRMGGNDIRTHHLDFFSYLINAIRPEGR